MHDLDEIIIYCPYCGEALDVLVDTSAGPQQYYEDLRLVVRQSYL